MRYEKKKIVFNRKYFIGPMSVSFTMKIRGVPFEAGEKEVFEVMQTRHKKLELSNLIILVL